MTRLGITLSGMLVVGLSFGIAQATELETVAAERHSAPIIRLFDGTVEAVNQATVSAQVSGRIVEINFDVHDFVPRDTVILRFKSTEQRSQLDAAMAALREAEARLNETEIELKRVTQIYERKLVSKSVLDRARADRDAAKARVDSARANVTRAREQLAYTEVRAPYSGIVVKRFVEVGESVSVGQPLMAGISLEQLRVTVSLPQRIAGKLDKAAGVHVVPPEGEAIRVAAGQVTVFPFADTPSHTVRVRIDLPRGIESLYPGMLTKVGIALGQEERLTVPANTVVRRSEITGVYVVDEQGSVTLRQVRLGRQGPGGEVEVLAGLSAGERVAVDPQQAAIVLKQAQGR
ncbi:MAG: efflux RND transporter periplasmic adaptor subunit [Gammaproteobacteria bacterium]